MVSSWLYVGVAGFLPTLEDSTSRIVNQGTLVFDNISMYDKLVALCISLFSLFRLALFS